MEREDEYLIKRINMPDGNQYQLYDENAIHNAAELGIAGALVFKGTVRKMEELPTASVDTMGHVYLNSTDGTEYVGVDDGYNNYYWEKLGSIHDAASKEHWHTVKVSGTISSSSVTGYVMVPKVTVAKKYVKVTVDEESLDEDSLAVTTTKAKVYGEDATVKITGGKAAIQRLKAIASGTAVSDDGTTSAITALGSPTTTDVIRELDTTNINNPTVTAGAAASWSASVTNGVLSFKWTPNTPTEVQTTQTTVATGAKSTTSVIKALGSPTTTKVLTGVKISSQPTVTLTFDPTGDVAVVTGISDISASLNSSSVEAITSVSVNPPTFKLENAPDEEQCDLSWYEVTNISEKPSQLVNGVTAETIWTSDTATTSYSIEQAK